MLFDITEHLIGIRKRRTAGESSQRTRKAEHPDTEWELRRRVRHVEIGRDRGNDWKEQVDGEGREKRQGRASGCASTRRRDQPSAPRPPARDTAATSAGDVAEPMPPSPIGCSIPRRSQTGVRIMVRSSGGTRSADAKWLAVTINATTGPSNRRPSGGRRLRSRFFVDPVKGTSLGPLQRLHGLEPRSHRSVGAGEDLVVLDVQRPQPTLLAHRDGNEIADLHQFRLREMRVQTLPKRVIRGEVPGDGLRVGKSGFLPCVIAARGLRS